MRVRILALLFLVLHLAMALKAQATVPNLAPLPTQNFATGARVQAVGPQSFKDWKTQKIAVAQHQIELTKAQIMAARLGPLSSNQVRTNLHNLDLELSQENWNLEVAKDLSLTDYLVLYLAHQGSSAKLVEAARKMTPEETALVLDAYIKSIGSFPTDSRVQLPTNAWQNH